MKEVLKERWIYYNVNLVWLLLVVELVLSLSCLKNLVMYIFGLWFRFCYLVYGVWKLSLGMGIL